MPDAKPTTDEVAGRSLALQAYSALQAAAARPVEDGHPAPDPDLADRVFEALQDGTALDRFSAEIRASVASLGTELRLGFGAFADKLGAEVRAGLTEVNAEVRSVRWIVGLALILNAGVTGLGVSVQAAGYQVTTAPAGRPQSPGRVTIPLPGPSPVPLSMPVPLPESGPLAPGETLEGVLDPSCAEDWRDPADAESDAQADEGARDTTGSDLSETD